MLTRCRNCQKIINTEFGADPPNEHQGAQGTIKDPKAPGDWDNVYAECCYLKGVRGSVLTESDIVKH